MFDINSFIIYLFQYRVVVVMLKLISKMIYYFKNNGKFCFNILDTDYCKLTYRGKTNKLKYYKYPSNLDISFTGGDYQGNIVTKNDDENCWIYITGLPEVIDEGKEMVVNDKTNSSITVFKSENGKINWNDFFNQYSCVTFYDDLD